MMKKMIHNLLVATLALVPMALPADPTGQALAFTCAGCHGTDGSSVGPSSPSIAGMDPEVFIDAMEAYQHDERNSTIMNRIAKGYSEEQIKSMAWFFAKQPLRVMPQQHDTELAKLGAKLHDKYCEKCHEDGGKPGDSGTLAGQWLPYLHYTMEDFIAGRREYPRKMQRKVDAAIETEGDKAIPALLHYYGSQH
ncbi:MAG: cytochrome c4 [Candidatus Thiodiazotropha sp.]|jgi:sulfide dehydrogenase cytochrome subunit